MKNILVTGGLGFIGSHTVVELISAGYTPIIIDDLSNSNISVLDKIYEITGQKPKFYEKNILDITKDIFIENNISAVVHFAAFKAVGESVSKPLEYYSNNIAGTIKLLEIMKAVECTNFVFSSSATVYGMNEHVPFKEYYPVSATNPYGYTKLMIEQILSDICVSDANFSSVLLRYFNPIGAHESGLIGEIPNGIPNNLLPYIMAVYKGKLEHLNVFGNDYDTVDGTGVRDYIHVVDLALGHVLALDYAFKNKGCKAINLGTGKGSSVLEVVNAFSLACGSPIPIKFMPRRVGDIANSFADTTLALELLGWRATKNLAQMCEDSYKFAKNNL